MCVCVWREVAAAEFLFLEFKEEAILTGFSFVQIKERGAIPAKLP
jgi:hypothetical protein